MMAGIVRRLTTTAAVVALAAGSTAPAQASERSYRIDGNSESTINIDVCSPQVDLVADGDNDTDLDYWLYDNNNNQIHTDADSTDITFYTIRSAASPGRCLPYRLRVKNLGNVYNQMTLRLTDTGTIASSGRTSIDTTPTTKGDVTTQTIRSEAGSNESYRLNLCAPSVHIEARGDGDTDLDFWISDPSGREVHSDTDSTDLTFATIATGVSNGGCAEYRLRIRNYGNVYNNVAVTLTER